MLIYLSVVFIGFLLLALALRLLRKPFISLAENSLSMVNVLLLKIDEDEKVKLVQKKNNQLILSLLKVFLSIAAALGIGSIPFLLYLYTQELSYDAIDLSSGYAILSLTLGSTLGFIIPLQKKDPEAYSELSQLLHRLALNNYAVAYKLFKLDSKKLRKRGIQKKDKFVIVSGLARAGTTSLMNRLAEVDQLASLTYANMPFLTAPNLWKKIYNPKSNEKKERSHKDGIMIGLNSNEALEEYFFKVLSNDDYIKDDRIDRYELSNEQYSDYLNYQALLRKNGEDTYLAKNNNFLIRYDSIRKLNKEFIAIFMFRNPLSHAASLLQKHRDYSVLQKEDPFVLEYMDWLGHHEFGLHQKPFYFSPKTPEFNEDKMSLDYWLRIWINYYSYLLSIDRTNAYFVDYEFYCEKPMELLEAINHKLGIKASIPEIKPYQNRRKTEIECSEELKAKAMAIYAQLKEVSFR